MMELWNAYNIFSVHELGFEQQKEIMGKYADLYCIALLIDSDGLEFKPKLSYLIRTQLNL